MKQTYRSQKLLPLMPKTAHNGGLSFNVLGVTVAVAKYENDRSQMTHGLPSRKEIASGNIYRDHLPTGSAMALCANPNFGLISSTRFPVGDLESSHQLQIVGKKHRMMRASSSFLLSDSSLRSYGLPLDGKIAFQSDFISMTSHFFSRASSRALSSLPTLESRS